MAAIENKAQTRLLKGNRIFYAPSTWRGAISIWVWVLRKHAISMGYDPANQVNTVSGTLNG